MKFATPEFDWFVNYLDALRELAWGYENICFVITISLSVECLSWPQTAQYVSLTQSLTD